MTDTDKWKKAWFRKLEPRLKCVWMYLCDQCDHAGIWSLDLEAVEFFVGEPVTEQELVDVFKLRRIDGDKFLIDSFIEFQYGHLNPENRVHLSVIKRLEKVGASKPLKSPLLGAKDKDKDKDKAKDKDKDKKNGECEGDFEATAARYPKPKGAEAGNRFREQIKTPDDLRDLNAAITHYLAMLSLPENAWRVHKQTFAAFLGTKRSGQFWRDFISSDSCKPTLKTAASSGIVEE